MKKLVLGFCLALSLNALADYNGDWIGTGTVSGKKCQSSSININKTSEVLIFSPYKIECEEGFSIESEAIPLELEQGAIVFNGDKIGYADDEGYELKLTVFNEVIKQSVTLHMRGKIKQDGSFHFDEKIYIEDELLLDISLLLVKMANSN